MRAPRQRACGESRAMASEQRLAELRNAIDAVDDELLALLNRRAGLTIEVGEVKRDLLAAGILVRQPIDH